MTAESAEQGSIKQRNALMDAYKVEQQLSILGKQIVLTDEQRAELARVRMEQARKIRDIEADNKVKSDAQKTAVREAQRIKEVKEYIDLIKLKQSYETKAAKEQAGSQMHTFYLAEITKIQEQIDKNDKKSIMNQEEKNQLLELEKKHTSELLEIQKKNQSGNYFEAENNKLQKQHDAGYLSDEQYAAWTIGLQEYQNYLNGTVQADEATVQQKKQSLTQLYNELTKLSAASKNFFASSGEILSKDQWLDSAQLKDMSGSLKQLYDNLSTERFEGMKTAITGIQPELGKLTFTVDDGSGSLAQYIIKVDGATGAIKLLQNSMKPTLTIMQRFEQTLKKDFTGILTAITGGLSMHTVVNYFRQGIQSVRELDLALTELKKVTDETEETYDKFLDTAAKTGARIGSTLSNVTSATAEFAKLGYNISEAAAMAEAALVYTNVGDNMSVETASQSIISTLKAFGIEADNTMSIVDKFNEIGNNFAITTAGIGDALQVSASAMAAAGNTLDETIALTTAAM